MRFLAHLAGQEHSQSWHIKSAYNRLHSHEPEVVDAIRYTILNGMPPGIPYSTPRSKILLRTRKVMRCHQRIWQMPCASLQLAAKVVKMCCMLPLSQSTQSSTVQFGSLLPVLSVAPHENEIRASNTPLASGQQAATSRLGLLPNPSSSRLTSLDLRHPSFKNVYLYVFVKNNRTATNVFCCSTSDWVYVSF